MTATDFSITVTGNQSAEQVFKTLLNVRAWWSGLFGEEFTGRSEKVGDVFTFKAGDGLHYTEQKLVELIPSEKIVWSVTKSNLAFLENPGEWQGTKLVFKLLHQNNTTQVTFTHEGLSPASECYDSCAPAWTQYMLEKLRPLIQ